MGEGIERCPYCMSPMENKPMNQRMTHRHFLIFKSVLDAGAAGCRTEDLINDCLPGRAPTTLRTCVYAINRIIKPLRIRGHGGRYYLERSDWEENGE